MRVASSNADFRAKENNEGIFIAEFLSFQKKKENRLL